MMITRRRFLKWGVVYFILSILIIQGGCGCKKFSLVVVRESDLRFGPVPLPLDETTRPELKQYLKCGGDKMKSPTVDFYDEDFYSTLLESLSGSEAAKIEHFFVRPRGILKIKDSATKWFKRPIVYSVIDATRKRPPSERSFGPLSVWDGNLWWIFYRDDDNRIVELVVTVPYEKAIDHYGTQ